MPKHYIRFDDETIRKAIDGGKGLGKRSSAEKLKADLNTVASKYEMWRDIYHLSPTEKQKRARLEGVASASRRLIGKMKSGEDDNTDDIDEYLITTLSRHVRGNDSRLFVADDGTQFEDTGADIMVRNVFEGVRALEESADAALSKMEGPDYEHEQSSGLTALRWLIGKALPETYECHFGAPFGVSRRPDGTGPPYGPGIRFIQACLLAFGINMKPDAIKQHWDRYRKKHGTNTSGNGTSGVKT